MRYPLGMAAFAAAASIPALASGQTVTIIDDFTNPFESESFITNASTTINAINDFSGLDAGRLLLPVGPNNDEVGDPVVVTNRPFEEQTQSGLSGVLGGTRTGRITDIANPIGSRSNAAIYNSSLSHNHGSGARSVLELSYGPALGFDATNGFFSLEFVSGDLDSSNDSFDRPVDLTLSLTSGDGASHSETVQLLANGQTKFFVSSDFGASGVDLLDIDRIDLTFDVGPFTSTDYTVSDFRFTTGPVPAPATAGLLGLGGLAAARRRRK